MDRKLCVSEDLSQSIQSQISLGSFNLAVSGGSRHSLDAGDVGLWASVNPSVPKMAMRIEAGVNVKCSGFHSCCHQNKNDLTVFWAPRQH